MKGEIMPAGNRWHGIPTVAGYPASSSDEEGVSATEIAA
jgi:hypothetical protein